MKTDCTHPAKQGESTTGGIAKTGMGMPMEGIGFLGYDTINKKYTMFWIDNMATVMSTAEGAADQ